MWVKGEAPYRNRILWSQGQNSTGQKWDGDESVCRWWLGCAREEKVAVRNTMGLKYHDHMYDVRGLN